MSLINEGVNWLNTQRTAHLSEVVTYGRDSLESVAVNATPGITDFEVLEVSDIQGRAHWMDWLIAVAELESFGEPEIGDTIERAAGELFRVVDLGGTGHVRFSDPTGVVYRIHSVLVG